ncbi:glycosyltransferase [Micropruina sp.]|uniref:glycosyltransferase n=1 Tax=Micropruina sp. TaxID=2737536 RepID=UPI0039E49FC4
MADLEPAQPAPDDPTTFEYPQLIEPEPVADQPDARPLTIAQFTDNYGPAHSGLLYAVQFLESEVLAAGHRVLLVAPEANGPNPLAGDPHRREIRMPSVRIPGAGIRMSLGKDLEFRLAQLVADPPDIIHVHGLGGVGLLGVWVAQRAKRPLIVTWHTDLEAYAEHYWHLGPFLYAAYQMFALRAEPKPWKALAKMRFKRPRRGGAQLQLLQAAADMLTSADVVTTPSDKTATRVLELAPGARVRVVPNGLDPLPDRPPIAKARGPRLLYVGRVSPEKGLDLLLDAFELVRDFEPNAELMIVGDWRGSPPGLRSRLQRAARRGGTRLVGRVPRDELAAYYTGSDVFVFPSVTDTQALVLHEAALCGLPLVITDPELNLVVDRGVNALVARPNMVSFSQAIMSMLRQLKDPVFAAAASARSRELAGQWTIDRQATEMMGIYDDLIAGRPVAVSDSLKPDLGRPRLGGRLH